MSRDPLSFLEDIDKSCNKVLRYTEGRSKEQVLGEEVGADAFEHDVPELLDAVKRIIRAEKQGGNSSPR